MKKWEYDYFSMPIGKSTIVEDDELYDILDDLNVHG